MPGDSGIMQYFAKLGLDSSEFLGGLSKSSQGLLAFARDVTVTMNMTLMIFDRLMAYGQKFIDLANAAAVFQSQIDRLGVTTGMSSEELYKWSNVARYADSDISSLSVMLRKLSIGMADTGTAGDKAREMLDAMDISIKNSDGSYRSMNDIFPEVIAGLNEIEDAGTRNTIAITLFGRGYQEMAGYMLLSKEQLKGYFDSGWAPTNAQTNKLRDYEQATKDLDRSMTDFKYMLGSELAPVLHDIVDLFNTELIPAMDDAGSVGITLSGSFHFLADMIDDAANGAALLKLALDANITNYSEFYTKFEKIQSQHMASKAARDDAAEFREMMQQIRESTTSGFWGWDASGLMTKKSKSDFKLPEESPGTEDKGILSSDEIRDKNLELRELTNITIPNLTDKLKEARMTGVKTDIEAADIALQRATNSANDLKVALGLAVSATKSTLTYNEQFASSLQAGGIGPDWAGFSEMANWSIEDLIKAAGGDFGMTGGSQNKRERAQAYLDRMQAAGTTGAGGAAPDKKVVSNADQSTIDTDTIGKELDKQGAAYTTLNEKIVKGWIDLEGKGLIHYTAMGEFSRVRTQAELDYMAEAVNFGGTHPIIQNKIIVGAFGPDWTPPEFTAIKAPTLKAADFSGVKGLGGGAQKPEGTPGPAGNTITQNIKIINNGVKTDAEGMNKSLGKIAALGGGLP